MKFYTYGKKENPAILLLPGTCCHWKKNYRGQPFIFSMQKKCIMKMIVGIILYSLFFVMCYIGTGTDKKNMGGFRSYPDEVQKRVYEDAVLGSLAPKKCSVQIALISNFIMFTSIFSVIGILLKDILYIADFQSAFLYFIILGEGLNLFDLVVIDLLWWRNSSRIRFSCVPEKEAYQNPKKHIDSFVRGIFTFVAVALLTALIVS